MAGRTGPGPGRGKAVAALLFCLAVPALSACTAAAPPPSPRGTGPEPTAAARALTPAEREILAKAEALLTRDCMEERGFSYHVTEDLPDGVDRLFPYVVDDEGWAAEHGYGSDIQRKRDSLAAKDPNQLYFRSLSAERREAAVDALNGPEPKGLEARIPGMGTVRHSDQGCESEAQRSLYSDLRKWYSAWKVTDALERSIPPAVARNERFTTAVSRWSACMRAKGHSYSSPLEARQRFVRPAGATGSGESRATEIATARAEARCASTSGLARTARTLERTERARTESDHSTDFINRKTLESGALNRARDIVKTG
ncbi:hypothetical protein K4B79_24465 [Streptomyces lincolnensis]|uniref:hypothetical protein n=1 Tax=Streptomyces lincolnensis TaxID=1915 RepID=UPI001E630012|nr:hypothetical protein [Streptomyces lincolnensis]MCD7441365.1 hypothetical protein [Streptomyces lincolnensis]